MLSGPPRTPAPFAALAPQFALAFCQFSWLASTSDRSKKPLVKQVNDLFKSKYGTDMNGSSARAFTGVFVLADAINRAASLEPAKIQAALQTTDLKGEQLIMPWDGVSFDARGQNTKGRGIMVQIQKGEYVTVWPLELASKELIWPLPEWSKR